MRTSFFFTLCSLSLIFFLCTYYTSACPVCFDFNSFSIRPFALFHVPCELLDVIIRNYCT